MDEQPMELVTPVNPVMGPTVTWITGKDILNWSPNLPEVDDEGVLDTVAAEASQLLYAASGRQFPGVTPRTVRPCRRGCSHWGDVAAGLGPWYWTSAWSGGGGAIDGGGDTCGCGNASYIDLAGYPVVAIDAVKIDGAVVDPSGYRLDNRQRLIRLADVGPPVQDRHWPACQDLSLDDTQPGTFSVAYRWGVLPPQTGLDAATQLAIELWNVRVGGSSKIPQKVVKLVRQGVSMERVVPFQELLRKGQTGLTFVDLFIGQVNPAGLTRPPAVFSPDLPKYARKVGQ